jgi:hypothetical protein
MGLQRIRTIKPEFFVHEEVAAVSFAARLLYIGLWTVADRAGRLEDRPARLKALLFPYDPVDVDRLLEELNAHGFIRRYHVDDGRYLDIPTFEKHQRPSPREAAAQYPAYPGASAPARKFHCAQGNFRGEREREREREREGKNISLASLAPVLAPGFDDFWQRYPLHVGKQAARKAWAKLGPAPPLGPIVDALAWQRDLPRWREDSGRYVPHPATYLNGRRWEDERPPDPLAATIARLKAEEATG